MADDEGHADSLARRPAVLARKPERVGAAQRRGQHRRIEPARFEELRVHGKPRRELQAARARRLAEGLELGPRRLRVDVVDRDGRHPTPVVDPRVEQARELGVGEVRRRLQMTVGAEQDARGGDRPEVLVEVGLGVVGHPGARLRPEVLDDHLLDVAVPLVELADREQRLESLRSRLADPDQDPSRERDLELAREGDRLEPARRQLVRRAVVRHPLRREPVGRGLEHDPHRRAHLAQRDQLVPADHAGIEVREQAGLLEHHTGGAGEVLDRRLVPEPASSSRATR